MNQDPKKIRSAGELSPPGMEHTENLINDFGAPAKSTRPKATPETRRVEHREESVGKREEPKKKSSAQSKSKASTEKKKNDAKAHASTATSNGSAKKNKKETVDLSVPRSAKPAHQVLPYALAIFAVLAGIALLLNLFCNSGNQLEGNPSAHWMGRIGYYICYGFFGLFGPAVFVLPLLLLNLAIFWKKYIDHRVTISKIVASVLFLAFLSSFIHICCLTVIPPEAQNIPVKDLMRYGAQMTGGGVIGGTFGYFLYVNGNVFGSLLICGLLLAASLFYFLGMTPQHLWNRFRLRRALRSKRAPSLSSQDAEYAKNNAAMEEKIRRTTTRQYTVDEQENGVPTGAVRVVEYEGKKATKDKLPPMPGPKLDPNDGSKVFVPQDVTKKMSESEPAETPAITVHEDSKPASAPTPKPTPAKAEATPLPAPAPASSTAKAPAPTALPEAAPASPVAPQNKDAAVDPIFPKSNDVRQVRRVPREHRNFDLKNIFIDLDDTEDSEPVRKHAPLPPEVPMPGSRPAGASRAAAPANSGIAKPATSARPSMTTPNGAPRPGASRATKPQTVFRQAEVDKDQSFGLSAEEFEKMEAQQPANSPKADAVQKGKATLQEMKEEQSMANKPKEYVFPPISYLHPGEPMTEENRVEIEENMRQLAETLASFHVNVREINYSCGPTVTRYEVILAAGVRVRTVTNLADDIALALRSSGGVRIEAPIPGTNAVGIEVPNKTRSTIYLRDLIESEQFAKSESKLSACLGANIAGAPLIFDIGKMPHLLVAGTTGSGKSVCINCIITSLLYRVRPDEVKLVLIDPKKVEFSIYKNIPHLMAPVVTTPKDAAGALQAAVEEMERRFEVFESVGVRNLEGYNTVTANDPDMPFIPQIVIIIDELADLMMTAKNEVETAICRIAQKARAAGMHLIIGTQRPSVDVVTGLIKANVPSSIAFAVKSQMDSRVILDHGGAESLLGRGDMLFVPIGAMRDTRVQGAFVGDKEVEKICEFIRCKNGSAQYDEKFISKLKELAAQCGNKGRGGDVAPSDGDGDAKTDDPKYADAVRVAVEEKRVSTSLLQRKLEIGYSRAAKIIDRMQSEGIVSAPDGSKPRTILITPEEYLERFFNETDGES